MKKSTKKVIRWVGGLALVLFVISGFILTWRFIDQNVIWFFIISGVIVLVFILIGIFTFRKVWKRFKNYFGFK
jgi:membrane protein YdbS with pleckstrin-like domain